MSIATTIFGPKVSFTTSGTNDPAAGRVEIAVPLSVSNTADLTSADLLPAAIAGAPTTSNVVDGELSVTSISVTSAILVYRSGNTLYTFTNAAAE
jgi:hypothetical protein